MSGGANSGFHPQPGNVLAFLDQRHPGATYRQIFAGNHVYVFRQADR